MIDLLRQCYHNYTTLKCCHSDERLCDCSNCLRQNFYNRKDTYECEKKANYYVLNYGLSYASEYYHYLNESKILENNFIEKTITVLSLGCGFSPDLIAINKYISDKNLNIVINYCGVDLNTSWQSTRMNYPNASYSISNVTKEINLFNVDIVVVSKVFSTLFNNNIHFLFMKVLENAVKTQLKSGAFLLFMDVNNYKMGRDIFHVQIRPAFNTCRQYYFDNPYHTERNWIKILKSDIVFAFPNDLNLRPLLQICQNIVFEYRK